MAYIESKKNFKFNKNNKIITIPISITNTIKFIQYVFSENRLINKRSIMNLFKYVDMINEEVAYENNYNSLYYFRFLKEICRMKIENDLDISVNTIDSIFSHFIDDVSEKDIPENIINECYNTICELTENEMSSSEIIYLSEWVQNKLTYATVISKIPDIENIIMEIKSDQKKSSTELVKRIDENFSSIYKDLKRAKTNDKNSANDFSLSDKDSLRNAVNIMYTKYTSPSNKLKTGWKMMNEILGGGFEGSRQYIFFGMPKAFKSGALLNMFMTICANNKGYKTKDPTKKPCVVYFTMENTMEETLQRVYTYLTGSDDVSEYTEDAIFNMLDNFEKENGIGFKIMYRPHKSVDTSFLYQIVDDMELNNEECICMVQDYIKRIKSTSNIQDLRIELGEITNEFSVFCKDKDIPLITASQLNREAFRIMESMKSCGKKDIAKALGSSQIGESALIVENTDYGIIVNREEDLDNEETYLTFKLVASRGNTTNESLKYFAQPFFNGVKVVEDINDEECKAVFNIGNTNQEDTSYKNESENIKKRLSGLSGKSGGKFINKKEQSSSIEVCDLDNELEFD